MALFADETAYRTASIAARKWNVDPASLELIANRENAVFRVTLPGGGFAALRLHRPGYHSRDAIHSELVWMSALAERGLPVPAAIADDDGNILANIPDNDGGEIIVDMIEWLDGVPLGKSGEPLSLTGGERTRVFHAIGRTMAELHSASDALTMDDSFTRHAWDKQGLVGQQPFWGKFWECDALSDEERKLVVAAREKAEMQLTAYAKEGDFGLIHADLVRENILVDGEDLNIIDFDDAGFGWRMHDIATALHPNRTEPDFPALRQALVAGYQSRRRLADADLAQLDMFTALRSLSFLGWIQTRMEEPGASQRLERFLNNAVTDAGTWLG